uniref:Outer capsid protein VP5 n=1 Tax=Bluetongue virus 15 TaxID=35331 RepID=Q6KDH1_BTV|nr:VP5 [Bluetongue virus 15]CAE53032.1 outer capsid protein VP5 [Bluetongue virus 15]
MGKIIKSLGKFGKKISSALGSSTAKKIYSTIGKAAERFVESDLGSATIDGIIQGSVHSALTGESYGESVKQAVILNVVGGGDSIADPLSPGENDMVHRLKRLEDEQKGEIIRTKHNAQVIAKFGRDLEDVYKFASREHKVGEEEEDQIQMLEKALRAYGNVVKVEGESVQKLAKALRVDEEERTDEETRMIGEYRDKIDALSKAIEIEREGLQDEAIQEIAGMSAEVLEAAAEEVPIFGAGVATSIATARAIEGAYKLKAVITALTGIDLSHMTTPKIQPKTLEAILDAPGGNVTDLMLTRGLDSKIDKINENLAEVEHMQTSILPRIKKAIEEDRDEITNWSPKRIHPKSVQRFRVPRMQTPSIHIYAAPWDSDSVFIFHVISPHHLNESFFLGFDLEIEYVHYEDLAQHWHSLGAAQEVTGRTFREAYREFFNLASRSTMASDIHKKRLQRSRMSHPIYLGVHNYELSYIAIKSNAMQLVTDEDLQKHVLRGPLHFQRRVIMAALKYGVKVMSRADDIAMMLRDA